MLLKVLTQFHIFFSIVVACGCSTSSKKIDFKVLDDQLTSIEDNTKKICERYVDRAIQIPTVLKYKIEKSGKINLTKIESSFSLAYNECLKENIEIKKINLLTSSLERDFETSRKLYWYYNFGTRDENLKSQRSVLNQMRLNEEITAIIRSEQKSISECVGGIKVEDLILEDNYINMDLKIGKNGTLDSIQVKSELDADAEIIHCYKNGLKNARYPVSSDGKSYTYNYKYNLSRPKR